MTTAYPAALDTYSDPTGAAVQGASTPTHSGHHANHNDAIEALEAKLGTGATAAAANTVLRGTGTGTTGYGQVVNADVAAAAAIVVSKLAAGGTANRVVGTADGTTMALTQINGSMIAAASIGASQLADNSVGSAQIQDGTIATGDLAANAVTQSGAATVGGASTASTSFVNSGASVALTTTGGELLVWAVTSVYATANIGNAIYLAFRVDSGSDQYEMPIVLPTANQQYGLVALGRLTAAAGAHTVYLRWRVSSATMTALMLTGHLVVVELKK